MAVTDAALSLAVALPLAWLIDDSLGEPRDVLHPVAWFGAILRPIGLALRKQATIAAYVGGAFAWLTAVVATGAAAWLAQDAVLRLQPWLGGPLLALLLKPSFAWRMLDDEVAGVEAGLHEGLGAARGRLSRIVSRNVSGFGSNEIRETAIESLAENLNDSVVAPLFWYAVFGLPGAAVYRVANTLDAMWGYRGSWEWTGKWSARADDVLSWLPARITAAILLLGANARAFRELPAQALRTPSPNSGWPMAAMALRLDVRLGKPGVYVLNSTASTPREQDVRIARRLASRVAWAAMGLSFLTWILRGLSQ
jgi:adenosylcobinamide-phosphate synthase